VAVGVRVGVVGVWWLVKVKSCNDTGEIHVLCVMCYVLCVMCYVLCVMCYDIMYYMMLCCINIIIV